MRIKGLLIVALLMSVIPVSAGAVEWEWTGTTASAYQIHLSGKDDARDGGLQDRDFVFEHLHMKITAGLTDKLSLIAGPCFTHHEAMSMRYAYLEAALWEKEFETLLSVEAGRFLVPFGRFNQLSEVSSYPTVSRPMMFTSHSQDIIIPAHHYPHPIFMTELSDMGLNFSGNKWFQEKHQLWYAIWIGNGMYQEGYSGHAHHEMIAEAKPMDISWLQAKRFSSDNNKDKTLGGRLVWSFKDTVSVGSSYMFGKYDRDAELGYSVLGVDLKFKMCGVEFTSEYAIAPTEFSAYNAGITPTATTIIEDDYTTSGYYCQALYPLNKKWEVVGMYDFLQRKGPELEDEEYDAVEFDVLEVGAKDETTSMKKISLGINYSPTGSVKIKTEYAIFSFDDDDDPAIDPDNVGRFSLGMVISF